MKTTRIPTAELLKEHRRLVGVLEHGTRKQAKQEARRQRAEMVEYEETPMNLKSRRKALLALLGAHGFTPREAADLLSQVRDSGAAPVKEGPGGQLEANFVHDVAPGAGLDAVQREIARRVGKVSGAVTLTSLATKHHPKPYGAI